APTTALRRRSRFVLSSLPPPDGQACVRSPTRRRECALDGQVEADDTVTVEDQICLVDVLALDREDLVHGPKDLAFRRASNQRPCAAARNPTPESPLKGHDCRVHDLD